MRLGGLTETGSTVVVYDMRKSDPGDPVDLQGILGSDFLTDAGGFSIDYRTGCLTLMR